MEGQDWIEEKLIRDPKLLSDFSKTLKEKSTKALPYAKTIVSALNKNIEECDKILGWLSLQPEEVLKQNAEDNTPDYYSGAYVESIKKRFNRIRSTAFLFYWELARNDINDGYVNAGSVPISELWEQSFKVFDVQAVVKDQYLLVKLPLMWSRYSSVINLGKRKIYKDSHKWMDWELRAALQKIRDEVPLYLHKNVCYIHVIPDGDTAYADNDNYDTKYVTDSIIDFMLGSDSALICSFSSYSMSEGELPVSSYVVVSPDYNSPPPLASLVPLLKGVFS